MTASTVANWFIGAAFLTLTGLILRWQIRHARTADAERDRILFGPADQPDTPPLQSTQPAVLDVEPGINLADRDECELLRAMNARNPGPERLRAATRNQQQKGD